MTIRSNTDLGRRAETHLTTITATGNFILFHAGNRKLGMSNRNRDNLLLGESRRRVHVILRNCARTRNDSDTYVRNGPQPAKTHARALP